MKRKEKLPFDVFLSKVNGGRAVFDYRKDQTVFRQGGSEHRRRHLQHRWKVGPFRFELRYVLPSINRYSL